MERVKLRHLPLLGEGSSARLLSGFGEQEAKADEEKFADSAAASGEHLEEDPGADVALEGPPPAEVEQLLRDYAPRVYSLARRMVRSEDDAEDVTQDVMLRVVRKLPTFRGDSAFPTWLHRVTVNTALSHRRKQALRHERRSSDPVELILEDDRQVPAERQPGRPEYVLENRETQRLIGQAVARLPEIYREVFLLVDVEGASNGEAAARLEISLAAVKSRLHRARMLLRETLAPYFEESLS